MSRSCSQEPGKEGGEEIKSGATSCATAEPEPEMPTKRLVVVLAGPTGVGKSDVAAVLCQKYNGIVVSADSVQAYTGVQIGANKPTVEERQRTPHLLIDVVSTTTNSSYNVAEWRQDALFTIENIVRESAKEDSRESGDLSLYQHSIDEVDHALAIQRRKKILDSIVEAKKSRSKRLETPKKRGNILPVVVGGTMLYLQWLVHGQPDALQPTQTALKRAKGLVEEFQTWGENLSNGEEEEEEERDKLEQRRFDRAVQHVKNLGQPFDAQVAKLSGIDWYRLRRMLEVAFTVEEKEFQSGKNKNEDEEDTLNSRAKSLAETIYTGEREGGLLSSPYYQTIYDVRCFFLCPDDRMKHTKILDKRCEDMIVHGLLTETTDLFLSRQLSDMATKAIGYRQSLDYLQRPEPKENDVDSFLAYVDEFTSATRRYARKQMMWFRKDEAFVFVPVPTSALNVDQENQVARSKEELIQQVSAEVGRMIEMPRKEFDDVERMNPESLSSRTRQANEAQGKKMRTYQLERQILVPESDALNEILRQADACTQRFQAKKPRTSDS